MSFKKEIIKDVVKAYKDFCKRNFLVEDENTREYFISNFINMETKTGVSRAEKLRYSIS